MFGQVFYHSTIRKYVALVGTLFNDIYIVRTDSAGNQTALIRVPITYGPKDKMIARVYQDPSISREMATAFPLPMISFEMGRMEYDGSRKKVTVNKMSEKSDLATEQSKFRYQYVGVPYNFHFQVFVYAKQVEDGTKIIEQILPYFTPDWTTRVKLIPEMNVIIDVPVILNNVSYTDTYDGDFVKDRRQVIWTLDLTLKGFIYGPVKKSGIIKFVDTRFYIPDVPDGELRSAVGNTGMSYEFTIQPGLMANGSPTSNIALTIPYSQIEVDDDYGFIKVIYDHATGNT